MKQFKIALCLALFSSLYCNTVSAELLNGSQWVVKSGDTLYKIARTIFPADSRKQARFRKELIQKNPQHFKQGASSLSVGNTLSLPSFAIKSKKTPPVIVKKQTPVQPIVDTPKVKEAIGKVVISIGTLSAENNGFKRRLDRRSDIYRGDTLITGNKGHTQIRLSDGALLSLRPHTELKLAEYQFNGSEDGTEKSILELFRGGFRTITGLIGHKNKQNYQVKTNIATIGIRGTHYSLVLCEQQSCSNEGASVKDGLYGGVADGSIVIENRSGIHQFNNDQFFQVTSNIHAPVEFLTPPAVLKNTPNIKSTNSKNGKKESRRTVGSASNAAPRRRAVIVEANQPTRIRALGSGRRPPILNAEIIDAEIPDELPDLTPREAPTGSAMLVSFSTGSAASIVGESFTIDKSPSGINSSIILDGASINRPIFAFDDIAGKTYTLPTSSLVPSSLGSLTTASIAINWGRWNNDYTVEFNGSTLSTNPDLHYIYSENITTDGQLANLGGLGSTVRYDSVNGTLATDSVGNVALSSTTVELHIDFINQIMTTYKVGTNVNGVDYSAQRVVDTPLLSIGQGFTLGAGINCSTCVGAANVKFIGDQAGAAITSFQVENNAFDIITTGVSALVQSAAPPAAKTE